MVDTAVKTISYYDESEIFLFDRKVESQEDELKFGALLDDKAWLIIFRDANGNEMCRVYRWAKGARG